MRRNQNFETRKWPTSFLVKLLYFLNCCWFFVFPLFSFCCSYWPSNGLACSKNTSKKASSRWANFTMEKPRVMAGNFAPRFSLNFLCIPCAPLGWALWSGYYWKDLFHLQKLSIDDADFGQKWWRQNWKAKARHGLHRTQWVKVELQDSKTKAAI